jgi:hypothetical protein
MIEKAVSVDGRLKQSPRVRPCPGSSDRLVLESTKLLQALPLRNTSILRQENVCVDHADFPANRMGI